MDLPYPVLLLRKATFHDYFLHPSWTSSHWVCLCVNEYCCSLLKSSYEKKKFHGKRSGKWPGRVFLPPCFSLSEVSWCFLMARVPSSPRTRSQSIFQKPLAVWSPCREPAPREFPARQRHHLPFLSACFKCHLPCLLMSQQVGMSIAWLMEDAKGRLSPGQHGILWAALDQESGDEWVALTMN